MMGTEVRATISNLLRAGELFFTLNFHSGHRWEFMTSVYISSIAAGELTRGGRQAQAWLMERSRS